jgi:hypothetical protein
MQEIAKATGEKISDIKISTFRPPTKPVKLGLYLGGDSDV